MDNPTPTPLKKDKPLIIPENELLSFVKETETPVYLYDEATIRNSCKRFKTAFRWMGSSIKNFFAVKATPNPAILRIFKDEGFGLDCSSGTELALAEMAGFSGQDIFFTSNNTTINEFKKAKDIGAIINLDDHSHIDFIHETIGLPELLCFRYNPGPLRTGNIIIGDPENSKFGITRDQILFAIEKALVLGVKKFGLHTMIISNCLDDREILKNVKMMFDLVAEIFTKTGVNIDIVNCGGGFGIPYRPDDEEFSLEHLSESIQKCYEYVVGRLGVKPFRIIFECGRYFSGPAGILLTRVINRKKTYKNFIGVDACMANLMRPALYDAYHHITHIKDPNPNKILPSHRFLPETEISPGVYDVVGSLCENNDKLAKDRYFEQNIEIGDLLAFHDTGAHGHCMGFNYNGKLKSAEYLKTVSGSFVIIRKSETLDEHLSTLQGLEL